MEGFSLTAFLDDPLGKAVYAALVAMVLDLAFGIFAAVKDGTFALDSIAAFLRKHAVGRVFPISLLAIMAYTTGDTAMATAAVGALGFYTAETLGSIYGSIRPPAPSVDAEKDASAAVNPIPVD